MYDAIDVWGIIPVRHYVYGAISAWGNWRMNQWAVG